MGEEGQRINSQASGNPSALVTIANKGEWKVEAAKQLKTDAMIDSIESGIPDILAFLLELQGML